MTGITDFLKKKNFDNESIKKIEKFLNFFDVYTANKKSIDAYIQTEGFFIFFRFDYIKENIKMFLINDDNKKQQVIIFDDYIDNIEISDIKFIIDRLNKILSCLYDINL